MPSTWPVMAPGVAAQVQANFKALFTHRTEQFLAQGRYIDGTKSRDASNTTDVGILQAGKLMGLITGGNYAPSIYGLTNGALTSVGTTVTLASTAVGTEIVRRKGATGTVNLIGPPTAAGVVRTLTATYSAISTTSMTITALGVNCVQTLNFGNSPSGTFTLLVTDLNGVVCTVGPITYSGTIGTLLTNITTALALIPSIGALIVPSGSVVTAVALTFSGTGYAALPQPLVLVDSGTMSAGTITNTMTTAGVDGRFVTKSIIAPVDGSQSPLSLISDWSPGIKVTDDAGASVSVVDFAQFPVAGGIDVAQIIDYPADASLRTWLQQQLSTQSGGKFTFAGVGGIY
ncbi:MAG: hypothetical protein ACHP7J_00050 [Terriglobales bacterium]